MTQTLTAALKHVPREVEKHTRVVIDQVVKNPAPHNAVIFIPSGQWLQLLYVLKDQPGFERHFPHHVASTGRVATWNGWPIITDAATNVELNPHLSDVDFVSMVILEETTATRVRNVVANHLGTDFEQLEGKSPLSFFGADDLDGLEISMDLEDEFSQTGLHGYVDDTLAEFIDPTIDNLIKAVEDFLATKKA